MKQGIFAIIKKAGGNAEIKLIEKDQKTYNAIIDGKREVIAFPNLPGVCIVLDGEAAKNSKKPNCFLPEYNDLIVGTAIFIGIDFETGFISLTAEQAGKIGEYLKANDAKSYAGTVEERIATEYLPHTEGAWYADFVIIKNLTDRDFDITSLRGKHNSMCLYNGENVALNLGGFYAGSDEDIARRKMLAELDDLKENLWDNDASKNYSALWNLCADYDNEQQDRLYLTDIIQEAEFVDEYLLEDYFQNVLAKDPSLARIRCFIGDTYDDDIYKFDGYGNLANVDKDDFIEVIDNVQDRIIDAIEPEKPIHLQRGSAKTTLTPTERPCEVRV